ncbi:phosphatase PAP2 family protein [Acidovorax delafieldii]|nr:phosphatase PAP2 family protein [Acidovorax delafieldii]
MQPSSVPPSTAPHAPLHRHTLLFWTLGALACVMAWDAAGQDLAFAQVFGSSNGFPMRDQWFFVQVLHEGARRLGWLLVLLLALSVWWPRGFLRKLDASERLQMAVSALLSLAVVSITKNLSATSCPWDLAQFGGVARHVSHWALGVLDGGSGRCFPAGHASAGFAFLGGYFALRHKAPTAARWWLAGALLAGFVLGAAQQVRGAHFMSHTLWTGWLCWTTGWLCDLAATALRPRFPHFANTTTPADGSHA